MISKLNIRILGILKLYLFGTSKLNTHADLHAYENNSYLNNRHFSFRCRLNCLQNYLTVIRREIE